MGTIGNRLKQARVKNNLKQIQVMKELGINNKTLSGYENGVSQPDYDSLNKLAKLYKVSLDELITGIDDGEILDEEEVDFKQRMMNYYKNEENLNNDISELLRLFSVNGIFKKVYESEIFNLFRDCISTHDHSYSDYERFGEMYHRYMLDKLEDPSFIDEQFDEEFTIYYNYDSIMEGVRGSKGYEWKEEVISKLTDIVNKNNVDHSTLKIMTNQNKIEDVGFTNQKLEEFLNTKGITYRNNPLTDPDRQRILDMLKVLFPDRQ